MIRTVMIMILGSVMIVSANILLAPSIMEDRISTEDEQELGLFPSGALIGQASCGFSNLVADLLWLRAIQYYGKHKQEDMIFDQTGHVFDVLTDLDPLFVEAYRFGALVLVGEADARQEGYALLRKGIRNNPTDGSLYFDLGFHHFLAEEYGAAAGTRRTGRGSSTRRRRCGVKSSWRLRMTRQKPPPNSPSVR